MLSPSISSTAAMPTLQASALSWINWASVSRRASGSILESASPSIGRLASRITAAATTGPASGPRPASSTPATTKGSATLFPTPFRGRSDIGQAGLSQKGLRTLFCGLLVEEAQHRCGSLVAAALLQLPVDVRKEPRQLGAFLRVVQPVRQFTGQGASGVTSPWKISGTTCRPASRFGCAKNGAFISPRCCSVHAVAAPSR